MTFCWACQRCLFLLDLPWWGNAAHHRHTGAEKRRRTFPGVYVSKRIILTAPAVKCTWLMAGLDYLSRALKIILMTASFFLFWHCKNEEVKYWKNKTKLSFKENDFLHPNLKNNIPCPCLRKRVILICLIALPECTKPLRDHVTWLGLDSGSCRPSEVNSAVIQKTATRRSKQTAQHKQRPINTNTAPLTGSHQQGGSESAEQSWALTGGWSPAGFQEKMLFRWETTYSHPKS